MWSHPPVLKQKADRLPTTHVRSSELTAREGADDARPVYARGQRQQNQCAGNVLWIDCGSGSFMKITVNHSKEWRALGDDFRTFVLSGIGSF
jgi:hypothetical protein